MSIDLHFWREGERERGGAETGRYKENHTKSVTEKGFYRFIEICCAKSLILSLKFSYNKFFIYISFKILKEFV